MLVLPSVISVSLALLVAWGGGSGAAGPELWTGQFGDIAQDRFVDVATDDAGNVLVAGFTTWSADPASTLARHVLVRKYDRAGNVVWSTDPESEGAGEATGVATDSSGNVLIAGHAYGRLEGGSSTTSYAFVRKYDADGSELWTRTFSSNTWEEATGLATDSAGNVFVTGITRGSLSGENFGLHDVFVRKYGPTGEHLWTRQFGTTADDEARDVTVDSDGNVVVVGQTSGSFAALPNGGFDAFVLKYDGDGDFAWADLFGSEDVDSGEGIAVDVDGKVYVVGYTYGALTGANAGEADAFLRAYDPNGNHQWTEHFGTAEYDDAKGVAIDEAGEVLVVGRTFGDFEGFNAGDSDVLIRAFEPSGTPVSTMQFGTAARDVGEDIAVARGGDVFVVGWTRGALGRANAGDEDAFVRSLSP